MAQQGPGPLLASPAQSPGKRPSKRNSHEDGHRHHHNPRPKSNTIIDKEKEKDHETPQGGGGEPATPPAKKPTNFFELLAAAVSKAKSEHSKEHGKGPEFLVYLKKSGIKTAWVRAIVALYEEPKKPDDPLVYILKLMGLGIPDSLEVNGMQDKVRQLRKRVLQLQGDNEELKLAIQQEEDSYRERKDLNIFDDGKYFSDYNSDEEHLLDGDKQGTC